jgi:ABC-type arginine transport system permease subunit
MANQGVRVLDLIVKPTIAQTDQVVVIVGYGSNTAQTALVSVATINDVPFITDPIANNTLTVTQGQMFFSNTYIYLAVANNYLKRVGSLSDF